MRKVALLSLVIGIATLGCGPATVAAPHDMKKVAGGTAKMGCNEPTDTLCQPREKPYHDVTLGDFFIDVTEVTVAMYKLCVEAKACSAAATDTWKSNWGIKDRDQHPVNNVTWDQAATYCEFAGLRLCTEAEWERAARGSDGRLYPWGNDVPTCDKAVMALTDQVGDYGCGNGGTMPVGAKTAGASPSGVLDMAGNVWEWVSDGYKSDIYATCASGCSDPSGSADSAYKVLRGGCFSNNEGVNLRTSERAGFVPAYHDDGIGIRCCKS